MVIRFSAKPGANQARIVGPRPAACTHLSCCRAVPIHPADASADSLVLTTIVSVRRGNQVVIGGDGQVSRGNTVMNANARKVRRLYDGKVLAGFAGGTADAFTLFEKFEAQLQKHHGQLTRAAVELAKRSEE